jgi:hypothetical protein
MVYFRVKSQKLSKFSTIAEYKSFQSSIKYLLVSILQQFPKHPLFYYSSKVTSDVGSLLMLLYRLSFTEESNEELLLPFARSYWVLLETRFLIWSRKRKTKNAQNIAAKKQEIIVFDK